MSTRAERFPIMRWGSIPWDVIAPHEEQAKRNHGGQSLERLAERSGLDPIEAVLVLEGKPWIGWGMNSNEKRAERDRCIELLIREHQGERA